MEEAFISLIRKMEGVKLRHIWAVTRKEFNHILRDRSTFILVLFTPTLLLLLMAYALTVDIKHVPIAVLDRTRVRHRGVRPADHSWTGPGPVRLCRIWTRSKRC